MGSDVVGTTYFAGFAFVLIFQAFKLPGRLSTECLLLPSSDRR